MDPQTGANASDAIRRAQLAQSPIGFALANPAGSGGPVVFISNHAQWGELTLTIKNNTGDPVVLDTTSLLQFYLWPLLTNDEIGRIRIATSTTGWGITTASDENGHSYIALRPAQRLPPLPPNATLDITLNAVLASGSPRSSHFRVAYSGFAPMQPGAQRIPVMLHLPADAKATDWPLDIRFGPREEYGDRDSAIYVTPWDVTPAKPAILNTFVLQITARLALPFQGSQPSIIISFLSGDTDASLCSDEEIEAVTAGIDQSPGDPWMVTKNTIADLPVFKVAGQPGATSMDGLLAIRFENLATTLPSGRSSCVLIQFTGMPGYNDGFAVAIVDKMDPVPHVRSLAAYNGDTEIRQSGMELGIAPYGPITLKWDVFAAENCMMVDTAHETASVQDPVMDAFTVMADHALMSFTLQPQILGQGYDMRGIAVRVPPPEVDINVSWFETGQLPPGVVGPMPVTHVTVSWTTQYVHTCSVVWIEGGKVISTALHGEWSTTYSFRGYAFRLPDPEPRTFQIVAAGTGTTTAQKTVAVW